MVLVSINSCKTKLLISGEDEAAIVDVQTCEN